MDSKYGPEGLAIWMISKYMRDRPGLSRPALSPMEANYVPDHLERTDE